MWQGRDRTPPECLPLPAATTGPAHAITRHGDHQEPLRYGAAVNARDYDGSTALDYVDMGWFAYAFMDEEDPGDAAACHRQALKVEARLEEVEELLVQAGGLLGEEF